MAAAKDCHALITYFENKFKLRYDKSPVVNRNTARWNFDAMLKSMKVLDVQLLIDYYFDNVEVGHNLTWFFYNYDKLVETRSDNKADAEHRAKLRRESEQRAKEWRERFGNKGITSN